MGYRVSSKGQVTIPQTIRERMGIRAGDQVDFVNEEGSILIQPEREGEKSFAQFIGIAPGLQEHRGDQRLGSGNAGGPIPE